MTDAGLCADYGAYVDDVPVEVLALNNAMSLFGLHRRLRGAALGHLAAFETTSSLPSRRITQGLARLEFPQSLIDYYDEHVEADAVHEQLAVRAICGALVTEEPHLGGRRVLRRFHLPGPGGPGRTSVLESSCPSMRAGPCGDRIREVPPSRCHAVPGWPDARARGSHRRRRRREHSRDHATCQCRVQVRTHLVGAVVRWHSQGRSDAEASGSQQSTASDTVVRTVTIDGLQISYDQRVLEPRPWTAAQSVGPRACSRSVPRRCSSCARSRPHRPARRTRPRP